VFQCYTRLAYIEAYQLKKTEIKEGIDGNLWIMSERQKTNSTTNVPLLPQALKIVEKYKEHPLCLQRGSVLPVSSNQKMNEYLKEVAVLCGFPFTLNTHIARRTFGSTVTLNNNVPLLM
jgi:integrase